jgi:cyclophilin family peptidyl-prolyl cis-trans isomerase/HEAT repeat protein
VKWTCATFLALNVASLAAQQPRRPLDAAAIDNIARLEMLEDYRTFDDTALARLLVDSHPEVRRRAAITVGRLADKRGLRLLTARPLDPDTAIAAAVVFAVGQLRDTAAIAWLDSLLRAPDTAPTVAAETAISLGKIENAIATARGTTTRGRDALARYLMATPANPFTEAAISEALLSTGRAAVRGDLAPILHWTTTRHADIRWAATWALARLKDPRGVAALLTLAHDPIALIRSWAVRGLARPAADSAALVVPAEAALLAATRDADRTVRTEAVRALGTYSDSAAVKLLLKSLRSSDSWIATSAAEELGVVRPAEAISALAAATAKGKPCALREMARRSLQAMSQDTAHASSRVAARDAALSAAVAMTTDATPFCHTAALQALRRARDLPQAGTPLRTSIDSLLGAVPAATTSPRQAPAALTRTLADYRAIVERWIVPDYDGKPRPVVHWDTPRGPIEMELYPGDAPLAVDDMVRRVESGAMVGTQFTRVVPDFVDQQETVHGGSRIRDEVNRHGLTRGNLAWATAGLDTGNPGYTLGHTPQPHNEGSFTSLGRVIAGMEAMDHIELGDWIVAAHMQYR